MQYLSISLLVITTAILVSGALESKAFALTPEEERNLIGFALGCKDGLAGKNAIHHNMIKHMDLAHIQSNII